MSQSAREYFDALQADEKYSKYGFRNENVPSQEDFFSSKENRIKYENILVNKGIELLSATSYVGDYTRPLGLVNPKYKTLGMGTHFFTWRNVPNNCPIVFWWEVSGCSWIPLFTKKMKNIMSKVRIYKIRDSVTFAKVKERYGIYSNMAGNLCLFVNDVNIPSSEALYQACKFPLFPKIQHEILSQKNAMSAKKVARKYEAFVRQDWNEIKFKVMRWCLQVKLLQNWEVFANKLIASADKPIVEYSKKDSVFFLGGGYA